MDKKPDAISGDRARCAIEVALLALAVSIAYANSFAGVFQFDDFFAIVDNPAVHSWTAWWADLARGGIRPLLKLSYLINYTAGGLFGFHLFNVVLHFCNTILIYSLSRFLLATNPGVSGPQRLIPWFAALLFAVHPMQVEAITYITGRSSSLMAFFYLGSIWCYAQGRSTGRNLLVYVAGPFLFLLACATKETAISLPAALLLFDVAACNGSLRPFTARTSRGHLIYWSMALAFVLVAITHPGYKRLLLQSISSATLYESLLTQANGVWYLLSHAVLPTSLNIDPDLTVIRSLSLPVAGEVLVCVAGLILGVVAVRNHPHVSFAILWFLLHTFLLYIVAARSDVINERHLYLGSWSLCLLAAMGLARLLRSLPGLKTALWVCACCVVVLLMGTTIARNALYASEVLLWQDTAKKSPAKARVQNNLGYAYYLSGDATKARAAYTRALRLNPSSVIIRNNLASIDS